jgi:HEAT repeat protein
MEESILRAAAHTAKNGGVLLDLLKDPPEGVDKRTIARALSDSAARISMDSEAIIAALTGESKTEVRAELARALARNGGDGFERLLEMARDPEAGIDADSLGAALAEAGHREFVPSMAELLQQVTDERTAHDLARSIVEHGGREGVETLLELVEQGTVTDERIHPLCESIAEAGHPEDATRLFDLLDRTSHPDHARALLKAAFDLSGDAGTERCLALLRESADGDVRAAAADILGHHDVSRHLSDLVDVLGNEDMGRAQWHLARAIAEAGPEGMSHLSQILKRDGNEGRKHSILDVLASYHQSEAVPLLVTSLLTDSQAGIRDRAAEALGDIPGESALAALTRALSQETNPQVRATIARALEAAQGRR